MNSSIPEISIVSSLWNEKNDLLKNCVESILGQSFKNFEWIIIDDGATLENLELLKSYNDPRIKVVKNPKNLGLTVSLNRAVSLSQAIFIARMDTDDISLPTRLEKQLKFLREEPDYVLCGCFYEEERFGKRVKSSVKQLKTFKEIKSHIGAFNPIAHPTWFFRRDVFNKLQGYNESYRYSQDYELLGRFLQNGKVANLDEILFVRKMSLDRISTKQNREQLLYSLQVRMKLISICDNKVLSFISILRSAVKYLFHPLFQKDL